MSTPPAQAQASTQPEYLVLYRISNCERQPCITSKPAHRHWEQDPKVSKQWSFYPVMPKAYTLNDLPDTPQNFSASASLQPFIPEKGKIWLWEGVKVRKGKDYHVFVYEGGSATAPRLPGSAL